MLLLMEVWGCWVVEQGRCWGHHSNFFQRGKDPFTINSRALSHFQPHQEQFTHWLKRAFSHLHINGDPQTQLPTSCIFSLPLLPTQTHTGLQAHTHKRQPNYTQKLLRPFPRGYLHVYLFVFFQIFDLCLRLTGSACWQVPGKAFGSTLKMIWGQTDWEMKGVTGKQTEHNKMP